AAEEHTRALQLAEALRLPLDRPAQENAVRLAGFEKELDPERPRLLLEPLVRESREGPGRDHGGDTRGAQSGGRPRESDEVSARRRRDRDDAGGGVDDGVWPRYFSASESMSASAWSPVYVSMTRPWISALW